MEQKRDWERRTQQNGNKQKESGLGHLEKDERLKEKVKGK